MIGSHLFRVQLPVAPLMMNLILALLFSIAPDELPKLGSPSFVEREKAHAKLKKLGPLSFSTIKQGLLSEDPEIRLRCNNLYASWNFRLLNKRAWDIITSPNDPDPRQFFEDLVIRRHVYYILLDYSKKNNINDPYLRFLLEESDNDWQLFQTTDKWDMCINVLKKYRVYLSEKPNP